MLIFILINLTPETVRGPRCIQHFQWSLSFDGHHSRFTTTRINHIRDLYYIQLSSTGSG